MPPITPFTLLVYVPTFLLILALYGNPFRIFFEKHLSEKQIILDHVERVSLTLASGAALIPLIIMILSLLGNILSAFTVRLLTLFFIVVNIIIYRRHLKHLKLKFAPLNAKMVLASLFFLVIFIFHLYPSLGLFVYPGNDPALYSMVTLRIVESGGLTTSWGGFAPPTWYEEKVHLIIAGFAGTSAFFHLLTGLSIEKTVTLLTLVFTSSISLGIYFLAKRLFKNVGIALCSAFVFGMLVQEPSTRWFGWGGNAELSSLFLLPITIGLFWELLHNNRIGLKYVFYLAFLVSGMILFHPFSAFYLVFCLLPFFIAFIFMHRKIAPILKSLAVLPVSVLIILPVLMTAVLSEMAIMQLYSSSPNPFWNPTISWNKTLYQNLSSLVWIFFAIYGAGTLALLIVGIDTLRRHKTQREPIIFLVAWMLMLFLVHENNPNGLYLIPFPLWYRVDTNRIFIITSFGVSIITGIGIFKIINDFKKGSLLIAGKFILTLQRLFKSISKSKVMMIVLLLCIIQISINAFFNSISRGNSPITEADLAAFDWIKQNTTIDATFFVSHSDAGYWIPIYTHRRVVIPFGVVTNNSLLYAYYQNIYPAFCKDPNDYWALDFLNQHNVSYVYVGSKKILQDMFSNLNSSFLARSPVLKLVYNKSDTQIFKYLGAAFNTVWSDDDFLSEWTIESGNGSVVDGIYKLSPPTSPPPMAPPDYKLIGTVSHELQLSNVKNMTYLLVKWNTTGSATYSVQVTVGGWTETKYLEKASNGMWTTSVININSFAMGQMTRLSINVEGDGNEHCYGYTDFVMFMQLAPLKNE